MHKLAFHFGGVSVFFVLRSFYLNIPAGRDIVDFATSPKFDLIEPVRFKLIPILSLPSIF